jgi:ubiquinone/menaquinone biosynthesis C-methylase UbiE
MDNHPCQKLRSDYDAAWVASYFDAEGVREWDRLVSSPVDEVSLFIQTHYLKATIQPGWRVLEIGAGAGRFTQVLAESGARVLVADISRVQLELNRQLADQHHFASQIEDWLQVDITDMRQLPDQSFDAVVAYGGPLSYVLERRDAALQECLRVLKQHGALLLSVMCLWGSAHRALKGVLQVPLEINRCITEDGDITPGMSPHLHHFMHMFRSKELHQWLCSSGLQINTLSASGVISTVWNDALKEIRQDPDKWNELLRMELEASAEPGALDMGTHLIAVTTKI